MIFAFSREGRGTICLIFYPGIQGNILVYVGEDGGRGRVKPSELYYVILFFGRPSFMEKDCQLCVILN